MGYEKLNIQIVGLYNGATNLPMTDYQIEQGMLIQSYADNGTWNQIQATLSATYMPCNQFNVQLTGGYVYNGYTGNVSLAAASWFATLAAAYYVGDFSINLNAATPQKVAGYDCRRTRTIWELGASVSWTKKALRVEVGTNNPFIKNSRYKSVITTPFYYQKIYSHSPKDACSVYAKLSYSIDFGKKTQHDKPNIDKKIVSGMLQAK